MLATMTQEIENLGAQVSMKPALAYTPLRDHLVNLLKIALNALSLDPNYGPLSVLSSIIDGYYPSKREARLLTFVKETALKLEEYHNEINVKFVKSEQFQYLLEQCIEGAMTQYQEFKLHCFKGIVINGARSNEAQGDKEYYLFLVNNLTELHLQLLAFLHNPEYFLASRGITDVSSFRINESVAKAIPGVDPDVLKAVFEELYQKGFTNTPGSAFNSLMTTNGTNLIKGRVSERGRKFIKFCTDY